MLENLWDNVVPYIVLLFIGLLSGLDYLQEKTRKGEGKRVLAFLYFTIWDKDEYIPHWMHE